MPAPYDNLEQVLNTARVRLNDAITSINGEILTDTSAFTIVAINAGWRRLQEQLVDLGFARLKAEAILSGVVAVAAGIDPGYQVSISWTTTPALPSDMISPLDLWERSGANAFSPMDQALNGLPAVAKSTRHRLWEWRGEQIRLPGATVATDIRVRYAAFLADFVASGTTPFANQVVPIMRVLNPFAWYICAEMARGRGDLDAGYFDQQAIQATQYIYNRDPAQGKAPDKRSELGKMRPAQGGQE